MRSRTRRFLVALSVLASALVAIGGGALPSAGTPVPLQDTEAPQIEITSPPDGSIVTSATLPVSGTASDNVAVQRVDVSTDGQAWVTALGTTEWSSSVTLLNGSNTVFARATDSEGHQATDFITVFARFPDGPVPRGLDLGLLANPFVIAALVTAIVVTVGTAVYLRNRRRRLGNGIATEHTGIQDEETEEPPLR